MLYEWLCQKSFIHNVHSYLKLSVFIIKIEKFYVELWNDIEFYLVIFR